MTLERSTDPPEDGAKRQALQNRADLQDWIRVHLDLSVDAEQALLDAVDQVLLHYEGLWRASKEEALRAIAAGFTQRLNHVRVELIANNELSSKVTRYFEQLVSTLTERTHRDVKTQLLNFRRFIEQVELFLTVERRGAWCAVGVADITAFKSHNDTLGHPAGDRILERVAHILRREVRASDLIAQQPEAPAPLHARFGGDEFCFFLSQLDDSQTARVVAERFWRAVAQHDWSVEDSRLGQTGVNVDIGVVCLLLGPPQERRAIARQIADDLFARADQGLYEVKRGSTTHLSFARVQVQDGRLVDVDVDT